jgi:uncharacterized protein YbjQ (UPF0145 family)
MRNLAGGESKDITEVVKSGRDAALKRLVAEGSQVGADGVSGVSSELRSFSGQVEFLSTGSAVHGGAGAAGHFTSSFDGKELFCAMDAGYAPKTFAFGNIAYSVGVGGSLLGGLKTLARGEIKEFSGVLNQTRHMALKRLCADAARAGSNAVVGVEVDVMPFAGFHEMLMTGTGCHNPGIATAHGEIVSCDLTCDELWSMAKMGYQPLKIVMGTAVYSLGMVGGLMAAFAGLKKGEVSELTSLVYEAREHALDLLEAEARECVADMVMGTDVYIHELGGGLVEFMAIGTAVMKHAGLACQSDVLPAQAVAIHRRTFRNSFDDMLSGSDIEQ